MTRPYRQDHLQSITSLYDDDDEDEIVDLTATFQTFLNLKSLPEVECIWNPGAEEVVRPVNSSSSHDFRDYARQYFASGENASYSESPLKQPLLSKTNDMDKRAALLVWLSIQRFMSTDGCKPEHTKPSKGVPVIASIFCAMTSYAENVNRKSKRKPRRGSFCGDAEESIYEHLADDNIKIRKSKSLKRIIRLTNNHLKRRSSACSAFSKRRDSKYFDYTDDPQVTMEKLPGWELDVLQFIIAHGLMRIELRDEIYCQICKQLTGNPFRKSRERGWLLMAMVINCFAPSSVLVPYVRNSLCKSVDDIAASASQHLLSLYEIRLRTPTRVQPPCSMELKAAKRWTLPMLMLSTADGHCGQIQVRGTTTTANVCGIVSRKLLLGDPLGFSLCIASTDKIVSLGCGSDQIWDYISEQEQMAQAKGETIDVTAWHLYFRCEMFSPWLNAHEDPAAARLICAQMTQELSHRDDLRLSNDDSVRLAARLYLLDNDGTLDPAHLRANVHKYICKSSLEENSKRDQWTQRVLDEGKQVASPMPGETVSPKVLEEAIKIMTDNWFMAMSSQFRGRLYRACGEERNERVQILVNNCGLFLMPRPLTEDCRPSVRFEFYKIASVFPTTVEDGRKSGVRFVIRTVDSQEFHLKSMYSRELVCLITTFLEGLKRRSRFAIVLSERQGRYHSSSLSYQQGDFLVLLDSTHGKQQDSSTVQALNVRNGSNGRIPLSFLYVLPTRSKPPEAFLSHFAKMSSSATRGLSRGLPQSGDIAQYPGFISVPDLSMSYLYSSHA